MRLLLSTTAWPKVYPVLSLLATHLPSLNGSALQALIVVLLTSIFPPMAQKLVVPLVVRKRLEVVARAAAIAGNNTVDVVRVRSTTQALFPWHKASTLGNLSYESQLDAAGHNSMLQDLLRQ